MAAPSADVKQEPHRSYVPAEQILPEFSVRAVILGILFGLVFGASTVYLGLKVGLTVSASIPIAVLSITILRLLGKASILENNIVQTTGSASESIAAGIVFTIPALLILGLDLDLVQTAIVGAAGGLLGVLLMIPLRRSLIVKEHGVLPYPEGTACAEVLIAGEKGGSEAKTVFMGFGVALVYKFLMTGLQLWREIPSKVLTWYQSARVAAEISPELLGVGYIIGPRIASYMFGGGLISALILTPVVKFFGSGLTTNIFPAPPGELIANMSAGQVFDRYVRYIAAGAVAMGGIISLARSLPTIVEAFSSGLKDFSGSRQTGTQKRTERDMPIAVTVGGIALLLLVLLVMLIITIPVQLSSVTIDLPGESPPPQVQPVIVSLDVLPGGGMAWNGEVLADRTALEARLAEASVQPTQPEIHIRPDRAARYDTVASVLAAAQQRGLVKIGIVGSEQFAF